MEKPFDGDLRVCLFRRAERSDDFGLFTQESARPHLQTRLSRHSRRFPPARAERPRHAKFSKFDHLIGCEGPVEDGSQFLSNQTGYLPNLGQGMSVADDFIIERATRRPRLSIESESTQHRDQRKPASKIARQRVSTNRVLSLACFRTREQVEKKLMGEYPIVLTRRARHCHVHAMVCSNKPMKTKPILYFLHCLTLTPRPYAGASGDGPTWSARHPCYG